MATELEDGWYLESIEGGLETFCAVRGGTIIRGFSRNIGSNTRPDTKLGGKVKTKVVGDCTYYRIYEWQIPYTLNKLNANKWTYPLYETPDKWKKILVVEV